MQITWSKRDGFLVADDRSIPCWSKVRNELNELRPRRGEADLFCITRADGSKGPPSMPRSFPIGNWTITGLIPHPDREHDGYLYPCYIATDAHQVLDVWELDARGFYRGKSGVQEEDYFYGLHFSTSDWTQGCIRIKDESDLRWLIANVKKGDELIITD